MTKFSTFNTTPKGLLGTVLPERASRNGISEEAPKNGVLEGTPRNLYQKGLLRMVYQKGLPLLSWRASSSPAAHQRDPQRTSHLLCERDPQLLSRMVDRGHVSLGRPPAL
jgi:hypothetical protein